MDINLGILFGLFAMLGYGLSNGIAKVPTKKIGPRNTIFLRGIFISLILLSVFFLFSQQVYLSTTYILIAFSISAIAYIGFNIFYHALKIGEVGIVSPIANSSVFITVLLSIVFFEESIPLIQIFFIFFIIIGIGIISINLRNISKSNLFKISSGIPYALITCLLWGLVFFLYKIPVNVLGPILTSFIIESGMMLFSGIDIKISRKVFTLPNRKNLIQIFFVALFGGAGTLFFSSGISVSNVSIVAPLTFANPLISTLYGKFIYKEKLNIIQYFAIFLILIGIILISYFGNQ
jgi:drug/metabolite transporter (DMT)-like permease